MSAWLPIGKHRYAVDQALFVFEAHGEIDAVEAQQLMELMTGVDAAHGRVLALFDVSLGASMPQESRRLIARWNRKGKPPAPTAVVGANALLHGMAVLLTQAIALLTRRPVPLRFFKNRPEARAWLLSCKSPEAHAAH